MAHDYYCVIRPRDPRQNPGHIPYPDAEKRNCEGCFIKYEADKKTARKMKQKLNGRAEYIERRTAYSLAKKVCNAVDSNPRVLLPTIILDLIDDLPAADVQPVRHGFDTNKSRYFHCSECDYGVSDVFEDGPTLVFERQKEWRFCHNCGAKMDGGEA